VADELHFARAAERVSLDPSGVSRQIRQLERRLGVQLFERTTRQVTLTDAGAALVLRARAVLVATDELDAVARGFARSQRGEVRIGISGHAVGPSLLTTLHETAADLGVACSITEMGFDDTSAGVRSGSTDIGVVFEPLDDTGLQITPIATLPRITVLPVGHRLAGRATVSLGELLDEPWVAPPDTDRRFYDYWMAVDARGGRPPLVGVVCHTPDEGLMAVLSGRAISVGATARAGFHVDGASIVPIDDVSPCRVSAVHRADGAPPIAVRLIAELRRRVSSGPGEIALPAIIDHG